MKRFFAVALVTFAIAACQDRPVAVQPDAAPEPEFARADGGAESEPIPGRYIVVLKDHLVGVADVADVARRKVAGRGRLRHSYRRAINGFAVEIPDELAQQLAR